jgi:hypothetical protein
MTVMAFLNGDKSESFENDPVKSADLRNMDEPAAATD